MFGFLVNIFDTLLYRPLFNSLILLYNYLPGHDFGLAVILLTVGIKFILYPISVKALKSQKTLQRLQPQLQEIQKQHKNDKEKQASKTLELYRKEKINPFSGLLLAIIQLPILIALYRVFWKGLKPEELLHLYSFVSNPKYINSMFFGAIDLAKPNVSLSVFAGILQFFQTKMLIPKSDNHHIGGKPLQPEIKKNDMATVMQKQMVYFFPVITVIILLKLPSALGLYWTVSGIVSILQQYVILKNLSV